MHKTLRSILRSLRSILRSLRSILTLHPVFDCVHHCLFQSMAFLKYQASYVVNSCLGISMNELGQISFTCKYTFGHIVLTGLSTTICTQALTCSNCLYHAHMQMIICLVFWWENRVTSCYANLVLSTGPRCTSSMVCILVQVFQFICK